MPVYRYQQASFNINTLTQLVPGALILGSTGPAICVDITAPTGSKDDLDEVMAQFGWTFFSQDPLTSPNQWNAQITSQGSTLQWGASSLGILGAISFLLPIGLAGASIAAEIQFDIPRASVLRNLRIRHRVGGTLAGTLITYTLFVNGVASALAVTMTAGSTSGSNLVTTVAVAVGDQLSLRANPALLLLTSPLDITVTLQQD